MFLKVNDGNEVIGTPKQSNTSLFHVEQINNDYLHLTYYETSHDAKHRKNPMYVTMKRSTLIGRGQREHSQVTVKSEMDQEDSCFKLKGQIQGSKTFLSTAVDRWMRGEPFFIKTTCGRPFKREQFVTIILNGSSCSAAGTNSRTTPLCLISSPQR